MSRIDDFYSDKKYIWNEQTYFTAISPDWTPKITLMKEQIADLKEKTQTIQGIFKSQIQSIESALHKNKKETTRIKGSWSGLQGRIGLFLQKHLPKIYQFACKYFSRMPKVAEYLRCLSTERSLLSMILTERQRTYTPLIEDCDRITKGFHSFIQMPTELRQPFENFSFFAPHRWKAIISEANALGMESVLCTDDMKVSNVVDSFLKAKSKCESAYHLFRIAFRDAKAEPLLKI